MGPGHRTLRSHLRCSDKLRSALAQIAFRRHTKNTLSDNSRKLGSRGDSLPRPDAIPFARQPHDSRSGAESAYLPGRTQTVATLTIPRLVSSRPPQFLLRNPTDLSYTAVQSLASETKGCRNRFSDASSLAIGGASPGGLAGVPCPRSPWACKPRPEQHAHGKRGHGTHRAGGG